MGDVNYYVMPSDTFKQLEKLGLLDEVPPHIGFITAHEGRYSKLRLITKKAATKVTPAVDKYMLAWSAVKGRYINSSVSNKKVNSAAIVECKGFKVRGRTIDARGFFLTIIYTIGTLAHTTPFSAYLLLLRYSPA